MKPASFLTLALLSAAAVISCKKPAASGPGTEPTPVTNVQAVKYPDSVFFRNSSLSNIQRPVNPKSGTYSAFPDGLAIDPLSGAIDVNASESGLRYKVTFTPTTGSPSSTFVVISGINYLDQVYILSEGQTIARPVYNGDPSRPIPPGNYDVNNEANSEGMTVAPSNGAIDLAACVRDGELFGNPPRNDIRKQVTVNYRISDNSQQALNDIKIKIYYYNTLADIPQDIKEIVQDHQKMIILPGQTEVPTNVTFLRESKPRPPCVIIVGRR